MLHDITNPRAVPAPLKPAEAADRLLKKKGICFYKTKHFTAVLRRTYRPPTKDARKQMWGFHYIEDPEACPKFVSATAAETMARAQAYGNKLKFAETLAEVAGAEVQPEETPATEQAPAGTVEFRKWVNLRLYRSSGMNVSGAIHLLGEARVLARQVVLGPQIADAYCNGGPSRFLDPNPAPVWVTRQEGRDYVLPASTMEPVPEGAQLPYLVLFAREGRDPAKDPWDGADVEDEVVVSRKYTEDRGAAFRKYTEDEVEAEHVASGKFGETGPLDLTQEEVPLDAGTKRERLHELLEIRAQQLLEENKALKAENETLRQEEREWAQPAYQMIDALCEAASHPTWDVAYRSLRRILQGHGMPKAGGAIRMKFRDQKD